MERRRPGPRRAGIAGFLLLVGLAVPGAEAAADPARQTTAEPAWRSVVADALGAELAALTALTEKHALARIGLFQDGAGRSNRAVRSTIRALTTKEVATAVAAGGVQAEAPALLTGPGGLLDRAGLDRIEIAEKSADWRCLAEALYFEARGEGVVGQVAVAEVILNRVDSGRYPGTVCDVVLQGAHDGGACQFSYNCDGLANRIANPRAWDRAGKVARLMLQGRARTLTDDALFFHADSVRPSWSRKFVRTAMIGRHVFYRPEVRL